MKKQQLSSCVIALFALTLVAAPSGAQPDEQLRGLRANDATVQNIKTRAVNLLSAIEDYREDKFHPPEQRFEVFMTSPARRFSVTAMTIRAGDQTLVERTVDDRERYAMRVGGIARVYRGNVAPGRFPLSVEVRGQAQDGRPVEYTAQMMLQKTQQPLRLELRVKDTPGNPGVGIDALEREPLQ